MQYICSQREHAKVVDTLLGFINSKLHKNHEPLFNLEDFDADSSPEAMNEASALGSAFLIVQALHRRPSVIANDYGNIAVSAIQPYMGASSRAENQRRAMERIERAVQGKFLRVNDDGQTFRFVVPEFEFLLAALATLSQHPARRWLDVALKYFHTNPHDPICELMLALGVWKQEQFLLRDL